MYIIIVVVILIGIFICDRDKSLRMQNTWLFITFVSLLVMCTVRYRVGGDALHYEDMYERIPDLSGYKDSILYYQALGYQPLYILFCSFCKSISDSFVFYQFLHGLFFNIALFYFIRKNTLKFFSVLLLLFLSLVYLYFAFEIQRETLAIAVFLLNIENLRKKRWFWYYTLCFVSFFFHLSAAILFVLPLFNFLVITKKKLLIIIFISLLMGIFRDQILSLLTLFMFNEVLLDRATLYSSVQMSILGSISFYFTRVILFFPLLLKKRQIEIGTHDEWFFSAFLIFSIFSIYFRGTERFLNYLYPLYFVYIVLMIGNLKFFVRLSYKRCLVTVLILLHVFFILDYKMVISSSSYGNNYSVVFFPYNSVFNPEINDEREVYFKNLMSD